MKGNAQDITSRNMNSSVQHPSSIDVQDNINSNKNDDNDININGGDSIDNSSLRTHKKQFKFNLEVAAPRKGHE